jgi:hypothetical protein
MKLTDCIGAYDNVLDKQTCEKLINTLESGKYQLLDQTSNDYHEDSSIRIGTEMFLTHSDHENLKSILLESTFNVLSLYRKQMTGMIDYIENNFTSYKFENYRIRRYEKGKGFFKLHSDINDYNSASRLFVILFYLNTVTKGGETDFPLLDTSVKPKRGSCAIFHPNFLFPHQANIPISHHKYTAQTYLHYK